VFPVSLLCPAFPCPALFPAFALPMPCPAWGENALKSPEMGTKIPLFAVYRSENRSKNPVNRQTQKDSH
jgi:hypothetical protein